MSATRSSKARLVNVDQRHDHLEFLFNPTQYSV